MKIRVKVDKIIDLKKRRLLRVQTIKKALQDKLYRKLIKGCKTEHLVQRIEILTAKETELITLLNELNQTI